MKVHPRNENFVSYPNVANFSAGVQNRTRSTFKDGRFGSCRQPASIPKSSLGDNLNTTVHSLHWEEMPRKWSNSDL